MRIFYFQDDASLLKRVCLSRPWGPVFLDWLAQMPPFAAESPSRVLLPEEWIRQNPELKHLHSLSCQSSVWTDTVMQPPPADEYIYMLNGRVLLSLDEARLTQTLNALHWDAALIRVCPHLQASRETIKLTPRSQVVGFRRLYADSIEPVPLPQAWPDLMVFKRNAWARLVGTDSGLTDYPSFLAKLQNLDFDLISLNTGGFLSSLDNEAVFLDCLDQCKPNGRTQQLTSDGRDYRIIGAVYTGNDVTVEPDVTLVGPVVLSDGVRVKSGAVIRRSIIGEHITVDEHRLINNCLCLESQDENRQDLMTTFNLNAAERREPRKEYRKWPRLSYQRLGKRIFDIGASSVVLIMLIPVFPIVMLIIKLTSPGPIFYKARRQGLHGKEFDCLKFRTMIHKADSIQERLRIVNQVDGPQFKIDNDPRISGVGRFLRDTCIDELPQFINVLMGQMSIVGPRPSPENENDSSPVWRDARLSVRPGITGLWQICRTRRTSSDFQEWVYYDTDYVRNLSFRKDVWICWKTAQKLIKDFLGQFG